MRLPSATRAWDASISPRADVAATVVRGLCVAVRTQEPQVGELVVLPSAVDVVELEWDLLPVPLITTASLAPRLLHTDLDQAPLETTRVGEATINEYPLERQRRHRRAGVAATPPLSPQMARIQPKHPDPSPQMRAAPPSSGAKGPEHLGERPCPCDSGRYLLVARGRDRPGVPASTQVGSVDAELFDPRPDRLVVPATRRQADAGQHLSHRPGRRHRGCELVVRVPAWRHAGEPSSRY